MQNQTQSINYKPFHKMNFSEQAISELLTEFKAGKKASQVKATYPQYFESRNAGVIYVLRTEMIKQGLIPMSEIAARMVATKRRLKKQKARRAAKLALQGIAAVTPTVAPKVSTIKESVANSMIKIDFHGTIIHIERTSSIIITKDQVVVR
jgi:hypothetical protein